MRAAVLAAALALVATPARADNPWRAPAVVDTSARADAEFVFEQAMQDGDGAVDGAVMTEIPDVRQRLVDRALAAYELAARTRPTDPEPHFRAYSVLRAFHHDCRPLRGAPCLAPLTPARAQRLLDHADAFVALAPDDPRVAEDILFTTALVRTRLGTEADLRAAVVDYRLLFDRLDEERPGTLGNLAEIHMMLGELDRAIDTYRQALAHTADIGVSYGLAVALDRDEQGDAAREVIAGLGPDGLHKFLDALEDGDIFFVPAGEEQYYLALAQEILGDPRLAVAQWDAFLDSGAHPQFAPRARAHRDALVARLGRRAPARRPPR